MNRKHYNCLRATENHDIFIKWYYLNTTLTAKHVRKLNPSYGIVYSSYAEYRSRFSIFILVRKAFIRSYILAKFIVYPNFEIFCSNRSNVVCRICGKHKTPVIIFCLLGVIYGMVFCRNNYSITQLVTSITLRSSRPIARKIYRLSSITTLNVYGK